MSQPQPDHADYIEFIPAAAPAMALSIAKLPGSAAEGDARNLMEQLQQTIRTAEHERDAAVQQLAQAALQITGLRASETQLRSQFVEVTSLIQERDTAMQESDRRSRELTEAARKLENAGRERQEAVRQRDAAWRQLEASERPPSEPARSGGDGERQLQAIRQARDDAHTQVLELQHRLARAEDQISDLEYQREKSATTAHQAEAAAAASHRQLEATALDRDATAQQVEELTRELDERRAQAATFQTAALEAQEQAARAGAATLEEQIVALCNHVAVLEATGEVARSGQEDLAVLQTRFEKQRLETIDLATRLQTAQREIRELSASLAEARLQVKFATASSRAATAAAPKPEPAPRPGEPSAPPDETPIAGIGETLTEKDARSAHGAMRQCFHSFTKTPDDLSLLNELYCHVHGFAEHARASGYSALHRICTTFSELTRSLYEVPEQVNSSTLRTIQQTIEFLGALLRNRSFEVARDPANAHVLAVDDDPENCAAIQMALESAGLRTTGVPDPAAALAELASQSYDLIVLDVRMPGMDGFELCHQIRELPRHAATPIIFLTGLATPEHREQSMLSGGSDFIGKPFNLHELTLKTMTLILKSQLALS